MKKDGEYAFLSQPFFGPDEKNLASNPTQL